MSNLIRYFWGLLFAIIAILLHWLAAVAITRHSDMVPQGSLLLLFLPAVVWSTLKAGIGPGLLTLVLSALSVSSFWIAPINSVHAAELADRARLTLFLLVGSSIVLLAASARKAYEQASAAEERLRSLIEHSPAEIFIKDAEGHYLMANSTLLRRFGITNFRDARGKTDADLLAPEIARQLMQNDRTVLETLKPAEFEETLPTPGGKSSVTLTVKFPILSRSGEVMGIGGIATDITQRKHRRDELEKAIRTRDEVLAVVSHDLKNPLNGIKLNATLLSRYDCVPENEGKFKQGLDRIQRAVEQMARLIQDILDVNKIEAGGIETELSEVDAVELAQSTVADFEELARTKGISLESSSPTARCMARLDPHRMQRVLANIIGNAIKFTPQNGKVCVSVDCDGPNVIFKVTDTGPGIPQESLPHIFDRYWQAKETSKKGTGLGLPIAKGIVEAHGGSVLAESKLGRGTIFTIKVPRNSGLAAVTSPVAL